MARVVVVTGCSTGFGRRLSEQLARNADRVYATRRGTAARNAAAAGELRDLAAHESLDLSRR